MHLSKAIREFSVRRVTRLAIPTVTSLSEACKTFQVASRPMEEDKARIVRILVSLETHNAISLLRRDIRFITAAIGNSSSIGNNEVAAILAEVEFRQDDRLIRAVFKALLASYQDDAKRTRLRNFLVRHFDGLTSGIQKFSEESGILKSDGDLLKLAQELSQSNDIFRFCVSKSINSSILSTSYGTELKLASIRAAMANPQPKMVQQLFSWIFADINGTPLGDYYEAILSPFQKTVPSADVQKVLTGTLVRKFDDPRIADWPRLAGVNGEERKSACLSTIKRWLSIEYLDLFIRIIEATAVDHQFKPRKRFWLKYFEKGVISDLTLILASDANAVARKTRGEASDSEYMKWASLNLALTNQSVLLMRLGDLVIAEWSHSGAMRFWKAGSKEAPEFHLREYNAADLRSGSIRVKVGGDYRDSIVHTPNGQWMRSASDAIEFQTGVRA